MNFDNVDNIFAWAILIINYTHVIITGWAYSLCFKIKIPKLAYMAIMILATSVVQVPLILFEIYIPIKTIMLFLAVFLVVKLSSESNFVKAFIFCCFDMLINIGLELLILGVFILLGMNDFYSIDNNVYSFNRMVSSLVFTIVGIPFKYFYALLWNKIVNKSVSSKLNFSLILFPFAETLAIIGVIADHLQYTLGNYQDSNSTVILTISFMTFVVADIVYMYFISDIEKKAVLEREVNSLKYAHELEEQHFRQVEEKRYEVAKIRHDINNQLTTIKSMVHSGHMEQAEELIGELENTVSQTKEYQYCSIPVVNAVISEKNKEAEKYGIKLVTKIDISDSCGITQHHLCSVFANLIDNAIRAERGFTDKDADRKIIDVSAVSDSVSVYITVKNYVSGVDVPREDDSSLHGYGQQILSDIARIYSSSFDKTEKDGEYSCTLMLRKKAQEEIKIGN